MLTYPGSLHNHSEYSNLRLRDALCRTKEMMEYAIELKHEVIAFTEHESVSNAVKIEKEYKKIKEKNPDFKVILGNEIYLCRNGLDGQNFIKGEDKYFHFILLARNATGHQQIRELSTRAWHRSYVTNKMRRVPTYYQDLIEIIGSNPGNVIGSTACLGGFLGTKLLQWRAMDSLVKDVFYAQIEKWLVSVENIFGKGCFYLELQPSDNEEQIFVNKEIIKLSKKLNIPYIITTDTHYLKKEDAPIHKAFLNSQDGDREVDSFYATTYLMGTEEIENYLDDYLTEEEIQVGYQNILDIKNKCEDYSLLKPLSIPSLKWKEPKGSYNVYDYNRYFELIPYLRTFYNSDFDGDKRLVDLIIDKIESDVRLQDKCIYDELNQNLETTWASSEVNKAHWSAYFLNLQNVLEVCWNAGTLVGPGRGSGVGFLLLYILDIIQINALWEETKCFAWRFLNPARVSVLDIDVDIEGGRRTQVLQALRDAYGEDRVANVVTFGTEGSKSAIQTAARGLGLDNDIALYISSLIPADRGKVRTLSQCYYGDKENDFAPIALFVQQMDEYPELWKVACKIEGLVNKVGEHAGGVIFVDEPFTNSTALMRVPNGDIVTQFDLHDCEDCSLIKLDLLSVECLDKIHTCLDLLVEHGYIEAQPTLKETYYKYLDIYNLERNNPDMWQLIHEHKIQALFQMEKQSGIQGIALIKPKSVNELAVLNSVIRLMAQDKESEIPLQMWAKYRKDINLWKAEMIHYGLSTDEINWLMNHSAITDGICESQEGLMSLVQEERLGGNSLNFADKCRKALAKKIGSLFDECETEYYKNITEKGCSEILARYVWEVLLRVQRGYSFNRSHCLAYSLIALQEMNLAFKYPIIFWNCACLITDTGGQEEQEDEAPEEVVDIYEKEDFEEYEYIDAPDGKTKVKKKRTRQTDYTKLATAIGKMRQAGIEVVPPDINKSSYTFTPDVENNRIIFGMSGILNVGEDVIINTIKNRPYSSIKDYLNKTDTKRQAMISLIKGGAFDSMMDRRVCMGWYLWETCDKKKRLTLQNLSSLFKYNLVPQDKEDFIMARRVYEFNRYLKAMCKDTAEKYKLDDRAINFLTEIGCVDLIYGDFYLGIKEWDKIYQGYMDIFRVWIAENKDTILDDLNATIFKESWQKYASGTISAWEMEALCFYYHEHELSQINNYKYGISDFFKLNEDPIVEKVFKKGDKEIKMFKIDKICGTCIAKNKAKSTVTVLTTTGVVEVKFRKDYFSMFDRQISVKGADGEKHVVERSWFNRGKMIMVQGIRSGDHFIAKTYSSTIGHTLYQIESIVEDEIRITHDRYQGGIEEEDND